MPKNNVIKESLQESFSIIKKNKKTFLILLILQLIFISLISFINISYQTNMLQSTQEIIEYLDELKFDQTSVGFDMLQKKSPLGSDPLLISRNFSNILYNLKFLIFYSLLAFVLLNGLIWFLTSNLANKNPLKLKKMKIFFKSFFIYIAKFGFIALTFSFLVYLFGYSTLKSFLDPLSMQNANFIPLLLITSAMLYFMYITFSLLNKIEFKNILKNLFKIGIKKMHIILSAYLIIILAISIFSLSSFYLMEKNLFLLLISIAFIVLILVWSRIFLILVVEKLSKINK